MTDPARQWCIPVETGRAYHRTDLHPFLPCQAHFPLDDELLEHRGSHDKYEMLNRWCPDRFLDLRPPIPPTLHRDQVLPQSETFLFEPLAKLPRWRESI